MRSFVKLLSVMMILSLVLAGCGGGKSEKKGVAVPGETKAAPVEATAKSKAAEPAKAVPEEITISIASSARASLKHLMFNLGSFGKDQGINVDWKEFSGGSKAAQALLGKEVDVAILQAEHVLGDASGELVMVSLLTQVPGNVVLVDSKYKDEIKSIKDLVGRKVGVSGLGSGTHQFLLALLDRHGIDPSSMTVLPKGLIAPKVFAEGEVVATVTIEPYATQVTESGVAYALVDARKPVGTKEVYGVGELAWITLATRKDFLKENGPAVARMVEATRQALNKIATLSVDELVAESPDYMFPDGDKSLYAAMLKDNRESFVADGKVTQKLLAPVWADMQAKGAAPKDKNLPMDQVVASAK